MNQDKRFSIKIIITIIMALLSFPLTASLTFAACTVTCSTTWTPGPTIQLWDYDPYNATNMAMPVNIAISCTGTPAASCGTSTPISYIYDMTYSGSSILLTNGGYSIKIRICSSPNISSGNCTDLQYKGGSSSNATGRINNSYSFVPNVGRTDNYTVYIVVVAIPTAAVGSYTTGSFISSLTVTY